MVAIYSLGVQSKLLLSFRLSFTTVSCLVSNQQRVHYVTTVSSTAETDCYSCCWNHLYYYFLLLQTMWNSMLQKLILVAGFKNSSSYNLNYWIIKLVFVCRWLICWSLWPDPPANQHEMSRSWIRSRRSSIPTIRSVLLSIHRFVVSTLYLCLY